MSLKVTISYPETRQLARIPHDVERYKMHVTDREDEDFRYRGNSGGTVRTAVLKAGVALPEVYRANPSHATPLNSAYQWLWRRINPELSDERFCTLFGATLGWTNRNPDEERRNYILGSNLDAEQTIGFDQPRFCGGATVEIRISDGIATIQSLLTSEPAPSPEFVLADPTLWYWATSVNPRGEVNYITRMGMDGQRKRVRILNATARIISLPVSHLHLVDRVYEANWLTP